VYVQGIWLIVVTIGDQVLQCIHDGIVFPFRDSVCRFAFWMTSMTVIVRSG
jgi:hypothetical protein